MDPQSLMVHQFLVQLQVLMQTADSTNIITIDETFSSPVQGRDQQQDKMAESERREENLKKILSAIKVYKKN